MCQLLQETALSLTHEDIWTEETQLHRPQLYLSGTFLLTNNTTVSAVRMRGKLNLNVAEIIGISSVFLFKSLYEKTMFHDEAMLIKVKLIKHPLQGKSKFTFLFGNAILHCIMLCY